MSVTFTVPSGYSVNVCNKAAEIILKAMGRDIDKEGWYGTIKEHEAREAADILSEGYQFVCPPVVSNGLGDKATVYEAGFGIDRLRRYSHELIVLADNLRESETITFDFNT